MIIRFLIIIIIINIILFIYVININKEKNIIIEEHNKQISEFLSKLNKQYNTLKYNSNQKFWEIQYFLNLNSRHEYSNICKINSSTILPSKKILLPYNNYSLFYEEDNYLVFSCYKNIHCEKYKGDNSRCENESSECSDVTYIDYFNETYFVTSHYDGRIMIWNTLNMDEYNYVKNKNNIPVNKVIFNSKNCDLISCSSDGNINIGPSLNYYNKNYITINTPNLINSILLFEDKKYFNFCRL